RINCLATREWVEASNRPHVADRALSLAEYVTGKDGFERIPEVLHLVARSAPEVDAWVASRGPRPFALVQPFASRRDKEWAGAPLRGLARRLEKEGVDTVLRWGPGERARAEEMAEGSGGLLTLAPATAPDTTARLAKEATLVVGADTGPTHLAAATGTPTVALYGPTDPAVFGPLGARTAVVRAGSYNENGDGGLPISAEDVYEAARSLLG
ncbi:MAG TPA: glycosyltransferase family 9 protein, partial [Thermoanaerobaculia bacterium]|nr:glycosyltransferase family 9 protein [Thermoanaerobaculia bacterium]